MKLLGTPKAFDKQNKVHGKLRDLLKNLWPDSNESDWYIIGIKNSTYEMNIGDDYKDLFSVYSSEDFTASLCENFNKIFGPKIVQVIKINNNL